MGKDDFGYPHKYSSKIRLQEMLPHMNIFLKSTAKKIEQFFIKKSISKEVPP